MKIHRYAWHSIVFLIAIGIPVSTIPLQEENRSRRPSKKTLAKLAAIGTAGAAIGIFAYFQRATLIAWFFGDQHRKKPLSDISPEKKQEALPDSKENLKSEDSSSNSSEDEEGTNADQDIDSIGIDDQPTLEDFFKENEQESEQQKVTVIEMEKKIETTELNNQQPLEIKETPPQSPHQKKSSCPYVLPEKEIQRCRNELNTALQSVSKGKGLAKRREQAKYKFFADAIENADVNKVIFLLHFAPEKFNVNTVNAQEFRLLWLPLKKYLATENPLLRKKYESIALLLKMQDAHVEYSCSKNSPQTIQEFFFPHKDLLSLPLQELLGIKSENTEQNIEQKNQ